MKYLVFIFLILFGVFHRITSSEFWPITISRTWLHPDHFEMSMLQKPLLTFILAFFHIFSFSDVNHLVMVKIFFSTLAAIGVFAFAYFVHQTDTPNKKIDLNTIALTGLSLFLISPVFQNSFTSVRSDQIACVFFSFFLIACGQKRLKLSLACLILIPFLGIKEILFLIPGSLYFAFTFKSRFNKRTLFFIGLTAFAALVWAIALNLDAFFYLQETFQNTDFLARYKTYIFQLEYPALVSSFFAAAYLLLRADKKQAPLGALSIVFLLILAALPQSFEFFVASIVPFIYLPLFLVSLSIWKKSKPIVLSALLAQLIFVGWMKMTSGGGIFYESNFTQLRYISKASSLLHTNKLTYLDGEGILPKQTYLPCFSSPLDSIANQGCIDMLKRNRPDVVIMTNRLMAIGEVIFTLVQNDYTQIYPNLYMLNEYVTEDVKRRINLNSDIGLPVIIF